MHCFTGVFHFSSILYFSSRFPSRFGYQHVGIQNTKKNLRKKRVNCPTRENVSILCYTLDTQVSCVFLAFLLPNLT